MFFFFFFSTCMPLLNLFYGRAKSITKATPEEKINSLKTKIMEAYHKPRIDASPKKGNKIYVVMMGAPRPTFPPSHGIWLKTRSFACLLCMKNH